MRAERESRIRRGSGRRVTAERNRRPSSRGSRARAVVLVFPSVDGTWSVNEEAPHKSAISYFPTKLGALRHAISVASGAPPSEVRVLDGDGAVTETREFHAVSSR